MLTLDFLITSLIVVLIPGSGVILTISTALVAGKRASLFTAIGCTAGIVPHLLASILGLSAILHSSALAFQGLKFAGVAYLLYLAWKIANSGGMEEGEARAKPLTFLQAAAFQWVNPKAWVMAVGVVATYTPQAGFFANLVIATVVCGIVNLPSIGIWVTFGTALRRVLHKPWAIRAFNIGMALLLVASLYPVVLEALH